MNLFISLLFFISANHALIESIDSIKSGKDSNQTIIHTVVVDTSIITNKNLKNNNEVPKDEPLINLQGLLTGILVTISSIVLVFIATKIIFKWWAIQYKRYAHQLIQSSESVEGYFELVIKKVVDNETVEDSLKPAQEFTLFQILKEKRSIHIIGKPGSGKSCALQMASQKIARDYLNNDFPKVPIYLQYDSSANIYNRIIESLFKNNLVAKREHLKDAEMWLVNELKKGRFIFFIDDVHKSLSSENYAFELHRLFEYKKNIFVVVGRDYIRQSVFDFDLYEVSPLDEKRFRQVVSLYLEKNEEVNDLFRSIFFHKNLKSLYDTPQLVTYLAKVYKKHGKIPVNKSKMFQQFWTLRNETDSLITNVSNRLEILSNLAFSMIKNNETEFYINENECCSLIHQRVIQLRSIGKNVNTAEDELNKLLIAGYLIRTERGITFEHDQWLEYFASYEIYSKKISIAGFSNTDSIKEALYFATGMFDIEASEEERSNYNNFLRELADYNIGVFNWCLKNHDTDERKTLNELTELRKDDRFSIEEIEKAYKNFIDCYKHLSLLHFQNLSQRFYPNPHLNIGVVVGIMDYDIVHNYGLRQIDGKSEKEILIFTKDELDSIKQTSHKRASHDYFFDLGVKVVHLGTTSVLYNSPQYEASKIIFGEIEKLIDKPGLIETYELIQERIYFETRALYKQIGFSENEKESVTYKQVLEALRKKRIARFIGSKHVRNNQLNSNTFNVELNELFATGFNPPKSEGFTTYAGLYDRHINDKAYEEVIEEFVRGEKIDLQEKIRTPLPIIDKKLRFKENKYDFTLTEWKTVVEKSVLYYEKLYLNYKKMIELNFPTSKNSFETYREFPMHIIAVENYEKKITSIHIGGGIFDQKEPLKISVINDPDEEKIKKMFAKYKYHSFMPYGLFNRNIFENEPLRRGVYELIENEYRRLF